MRYPVHVGARPRVVGSHSFQHFLEELGTHRGTRLEDDLKLEGESECIQIGCAIRHSVFRFFAIPLYIIGYLRGYPQLDS